MNSQSKEMLKYYEDLITVIEENLDNFNVVMEYVKELPMSRGAFLYNFKRDFGYTIREYFVSRKLYIISEMIKNSSMSILDIALTFGYEYPNALNAAFVRTFGMTPLEYRKSEIEFENNFINIEDINMNNKVNYYGTYCEWLEGYRMYKHEVRLYKFDLENVVTPFQLLTKEVIESSVKAGNIEVQNMTIKSTRLNRYEKKIFEKLIYPRLSDKNRTFHFDIAEISEITRLNEEDIRTVARGLLRHVVNIEGGGYFSYNKIFNYLSIKGDSIEISITKQI